MGRLRLHAGKYILGITAPTGTGVQALPPWDPRASPFDSSYIGCMLWRVRNSRGRPLNAPAAFILRHVMSAFEVSAYDPKRTCRGLWLQQPMIPRGKERPIRERWLKDWDRWTSARPAPGVR